MSQYQTRERSKGTLQTWELLSGNVLPGMRTAMDIGCNEGVFSRNLADCGLFVTGFDLNYDAIVNGLKLKQSGFSENCLLGHYALPPENVDLLPECDVVLLLSVHHQWWQHWGPEVANRMLLAVAGKARRQFFFAPACIAAKYKSPPVPFADNDYPAIGAYFAGLLAAVPGKKLHILGMTANELPPEEPLRPLFLLQDESLAPPQGRSGLVPHGLGIVGSRSRVVDVETARCVDFLNMSYGEPGWHYFVATLREYQKNPGLRYQDSVLWRYYQSFRPANLQSAFGLDAQDAGALRNVPVTVYSPLLPWEQPSPRAVQADGKLTIDAAVIPPEDFHRCGPLSDEAGQNEFARIIKVYENLRLNGYHPELYPDGHIRGILFRDGDDYRFQTTGGQHRMAALAALGAATVRVKLQARANPVITRQELFDWPGVKLHLYTPTQADVIFRSRFDTRGNHARRLLET